MGYTKLDIKSIRLKALSSTKVKEKALEKAEKKVSQEKNKLIEAFDNHEVTKEIAAGPKTSNTSGTLGGYGNLFSFIGFDAGSDPITPVKELLNEIEVKNIKKNGDEYNVTVKYPSQNEISKVTPLPFENGRSWAIGIEKGISGFTQYIYTKFLDGRSKQGVQSDKAKGLGSFKKQDYLNLLIQNFINNIRGNKK
jgi:hypothetical protein